MSDELAKLAKLREPFPQHQISKLPKPTKQQTEAIRQDFRKGIRCKICGGWHHPDVVHLDYVGHAALTDRLLDVDPCWSWEPVAWDDNGLPRFDGNGGLWIRLTVCGVTRLGFGHPDGKTGGDAVKETIGDALRNAAMRFGAALDLWHKGDLHAPAENGEDESEDGASVSALTPEESKILADLEAAASAGPQALQMAFTAIPKSEAKARVWAAHGPRLKAIADEHRRADDNQPAPGEEEQA